MGWLKWGPAQSDPNQRLWVYASAAMFWLAAAMLALCIRDLASFLRHGSRPPTQSELPADSKNPGNPIRRWMESYQALAGAIGLIAGALIGHFAWKP